VLVLDFEESGSPLEYALKIVDGSRSPAVVSYLVVDCVFAAPQALSSPTVAVINPQVATQTLLQGVRLTYNCINLS